MDWSISICVNSWCRLFVQSSFLLLLRSIYWICICSPVQQSVQQQKHKFLQDDAEDGDDCIDSVPGREAGISIITFKNMKMMMVAMPMTMISCSISWPTGWPAPIWLHQWVGALQKHIRSLWWWAWSWSWEWEWGWSCPRQMCMHFNLLWPKYSCQLNLNSQTPRWKILSKMSSRVTRIIYLHLQEHTFYTAHLVVVPSNIWDLGQRKSAETNDNLCSKILLLWGFNFF